MWTPLGARWPWAPRGAHLDPAGIPDGVLSLRVTNWTKLLDAGERAGFLPPSMRGQVDTMLRLLEARGGTPGGLDLDLIFTDGQMMLAGIPLAPRRGWFSSNGRLAAVAATAIARRVKVKVVLVKAVRLWPQHRAKRPAGAPVHPAQGRAAAPRAPAPQQADRAAVRQLKPRNVNRAAFAMFGDLAPLRLFRVRQA